MKLLLYIKVDGKAELLTLLYYVYYFLQCSEKYLFINFCKKIIMLVSLKSHNMCLIYIHLKPTYKTTDSFSSSVAVKMQKKRRHWLNIAS